MGEPEPAKRGWIPRPETTADFVVSAFVGIIAVTLLTLTFAIIVTGLFTNDKVGAYIAIITDLMTTLIAAIVGFIAGRAINGKKNGA